MSTPSSEHLSIDLSLNENQFETLSWADVIFEALGPDDLSRYQREPVLKEQLCRLYGVGADSVYLFCGAEGALETLMSGYFLRSRSARGILLSDVGWHYYPELAARLGIRVHTFRLFERDDAYEFDVEEIRARIFEYRPAVLLIDSPNNPTGCALSDEQIRAVHALLEREELLVIDETYFGFSGRADNRGRLIGEMPNLLFIRSFSKFYGLAGMRVGYVLAAAGAKDRLELRDPFLGFDVLAQRLACRALDASTRFQCVAEKVRRERELLFRFFERIPSFRPYRSEANFILLRISGERSLSAASYVEFLGHHGMKIRLFPRDGQDGFIRISVGTPEQMQRLRGLTELYAGECTRAPEDPVTTLSEDVGLTLSEDVGLRYGAAGAG